MEFIMTYGWALMIVLVMIGAISYFGVLNPSKLLPSTCAVGTELACEDYTIANEAGNGVVRAIFTQNVGRTIYVDTFTCRYGDREVVLDVEGVAWSPSERMAFECAMDEFQGLEGQKVKVFFELTYRRSQTGFTHFVAGDVFTEVA